MYKFVLRQIAFCDFKQWGLVIGKKCRNGWFRRTKLPDWKCIHIVYIFTHYLLIFCLLFFGNNASSSTKQHIFIHFVCFLLPFFREPGRYVATESDKYE